MQIAHGEEAGGDGGWLMGGSPDLLHSDSLMEEAAFQSAVSDETG